MKLQAEVTAKIVELRFPFAGKVSWLNAEVGGKVKKGQGLAKLDTMMLKKRLEKENKDYLKIRASFEQIKRRYERSDDPDKKYILDKAQAELEVAVLAVELSQAELDKTVLHAPADGIIINDGNLIVGQHIRPASFALRMIVDGTLKISAKLSQEKFHLVKPEQYAEFIPIAIPSKTYKGRVLSISPVPPDRRSSDFQLTVVLEQTENLRPGMKGDLIFYNNQ